MDPLSTILFQYYQRNLSYFPIKPTATEANDQPQEIVKLYELSGVNIDVSALSRQAEAFSKTVGDDQEAKSGLRAFIVEFGKNPNREEMVSTFASLRDLQLKKPEQFTETLATAAKIQDTGAPVAPFLQTAGKLYEQEPQGLKGFLEQTTTILKAEATSLQKRETLGSFFSTMNDWLSDTSQPELLGKMEALYADLGASQTLEEKNEFLRTTGINK